MIGIDHEEICLSRNCGAYKTAALFDQLRQFVGRELVVHNKNLPVQGLVPRIVIRRDFRATFLRGNFRSTDMDNPTGVNRADVFSPELYGEAKIVQNRPYRLLEGQVDDPRSRSVALVDDMIRLQCHTFPALRQILVR